MAATRTWRALDWLKGSDRPHVALHDINDDMVSRAVEARRKHVRHARRRDAKGTQLYRPVSARTVNKTVPALLRRVMNRARKAWSVAILGAGLERAFLGRAQAAGAGDHRGRRCRLDSVESQDYAELREFAEIMGLRRKELLLTWPQVDFEQATIAIIGKGGVPADVAPHPPRLRDPVGAARQSR
jgi:hypothetical protein